MDNKNKFYYGWFIAGTGFLLMALIYSTLASCQGLFVIPVTEDLGVPRGNFSLVITIASLGLIAGSTFMGKVFTKYSLKKVVIVCTLVVVLSLFGFSRAQSLIHFYLIAPILGIAFSGATVIPVSILINNWFGTKKKGLAMSIAFAGSGVGGMFLTMLLNKIIQAYGWRMAYLANALIILFIVVPLLLFVIVEKPSNKGLKRIGDLENEVKSNEGLTLAQAKKTSAFWIVFFSFFIISLINSALLNHQVSYMNDIGFSETASANISALAIGGLTIGKIILGSLCDKLGLKRSAFIANSFFVLAIVFLVLASNVAALAYMYVLLFCIGGAMPTICPPLFVSKLFGEKEFGSLVGMLNVAAGFGAALGSLLLGKLYDAFGNYNVGLVLIIVLGTIIIFMHYTVLTMKRKEIEV